MTAAGPAPRFAPDPGRRSMLAKVHLAKKELGLLEEDYRALLVRVAGVASAGAMGEAKLARVLDEFRRLGWQQRPAKPRAGSAKAADSPAARKARALWISLHQLGVVRNPSEVALQAFAKRQLKVDRLEWADAGQAYRLIEALKAMAERAGWKQDVSGIPEERQAAELQRRLIEAIYAQLVALRPDVPTLNGYANRYPTGGYNWRGLYPHNLAKLARVLADELAAARVEAPPSER